MDTERGDAADRIAHGRAAHWDAVYCERGATGVSWYEAAPTVSLDLLDELEVGPAAAVVDVGGGASPLAGALLDRGHTDVTVVDVSGTGLDLARRALGDGADLVSLVRTDVLTWQPDRRYDVWHDRAVFHFLTDPADQVRYAATLDRALRPGGVVIIGTFASDGPERCSGLPVLRHEPHDLVALLGPRYRLVASRHDVHTTPAGAEQRFAWAALRADA